MANKLAKRKKEELIWKMQGTPNDTKSRLEYVRQYMLGINTSSELAEILNITRQTMSKLEKCISQLSGAQYLAIGWLMDKRKNELLHDIKYNMQSTGYIIKALISMSDFYEKDFLKRILHDIDISLNGDFTGILGNNYANASKIVFQKETLTELKNLSFFDNWLTTLDYETTLDKWEALRNEKIVILLDNEHPENEIDNLLNLITDYLEIKNKDNCLYFDYNQVINILTYIKGNICDIEDDLLADYMNFFTKFSLLKKRGFVKLIDAYRLPPLSFMKDVCYVISNKKQAIIMKFMHLYYSYELMKYNSFYCKLWTKIIISREFVDYNFERWEGDDYYYNAVRGFDTYLSSLGYIVADSNSWDNDDDYITIGMKKYLNDIINIIDDSFASDNTNFSNYIKLEDENINDIIKWIKKKKSIKTSKDLLDKELESLLSYVMHYLNE